MAAVCIFVMFKNYNLKYSKAINAIAATTFGVLMIHTNSATMRRFLWIDLFDNAGHFTSSMLALYACGVVLIVYVVCVCIDLLRISFVEKPFFKWLDKYEWVHKSLW